jgi:hypothetical protein
LALSTKFQHSLTKKRGLCGLGFIPKIGFVFSTTARSSRSGFIPTMRFVLFAAVGLKPDLQEASDGVGQASA